MRGCRLLSSVAVLLLTTTGGAGAQVPAAALTGAVTSAQEGAMEGVLVTAKRDGATIATTVVTDAKGQYSFPASRLLPGRYTIKIRAVGYNLETGSAATVTAGRTAKTDIRLRRTGNLSAQLTNAEWLLSVPGSDQQKSFLRECVGCHTLRLITGSVHTAEDFTRIIPEMGTYFPGTMPGKKQLLPASRVRGGGNAAAIEAAAKYLETTNLSKTGKYGYALQTMPRPEGRATRVIITEYELPRAEAMPHDAIGVDGKIYYSDFGALHMGELDPATGKVTDYKLPLMKPSAPQGVLGLHPDRAGNLWVAMMYQGGLVKFDSKTKQMTAYPIPAEWQNGGTQESMVSPRNSHVDGKVWTNDQSDHSFLRLDTRTGKYEKFPVLRDQNGETITGYEIPSDQDNNLWALESGGSGQKIGRVDAKTITLRTWKSPFAQPPRPRRGQFDKDGILWFGEFAGNAIGSFDPKTEAFKEWIVPLPWQLPYDVVKSELTGDVWTGSMTTDRVTRFDPRTGEFAHYLLPENTNIRRVWVDDSTGAFWTGANHRPVLVKLEPLD